MKKYFITGTGFFIFLLAAQAPAVTIFECVDEAGNSTYQDRCPPGTTPANEKDFRTGSGDSKPAATPGAAPPDVEILMYSAPNCDACLILRGVLDEYKAPYTDKNINAGDEVKRELQEKVGGAETLTIPTIIVGETVIAGFKKDNLISTLEQAGFKKPVAETEEEETAVETTEGETTTGPTAPTGTLEVVEDEQGRQILRPVEQ
jgi:glutaredoxin